jgi:transcriptional regulator with PAS, ATPase and Fis domain
MRARGPEDKFHARGQVHFPQPISLPQADHDRLTGKSRRMLSMYKVIERVSQSKCTVLILGETGTGKEVVARSIHSSSPNKSGPFVAVDCASLSPHLIEAELFGFVSGAFTGAYKDRRGLIQSANGGVLFLDEIGNLGVTMQTKLLRAIQEREVRPIGSTSSVPLHVRIIAATNVNLENAVANGSFREDLFYRLNVAQIVVPPLRYRKSDIPLLIYNHISNLIPSGYAPRVVSDECMKIMKNYDWPGNVRELQNAIEHGMAFASGETIQPSDLPDQLLRGNYERMSSAAYSLSIADVRRSAIEEALEKTGGNRRAACQLLRIGRTTLYRGLAKAW